MSSTTITQALNKCFFCKKIENNPENLRKCFCEKTICLGCFKRLRTEDTKFEFYEMIFRCQSHTGVQYKNELLKLGYISTNYLFPAGICFGKIPTLETKSNL